jgi:hypothetical protein
LSKRPPELTWQDKAILVAIPIVVFTIFILANYFSQDLSVPDAYAQQLPKALVRDGGNIVQVYPQTATDSAMCRLRARDNKTEYDFIFNITGSETIQFEVGRLLQFYGEYEYDMKGGKVTAPYKDKDKSGRMIGWAIYENHRYVPQNEKDSKDSL